MNRISAVIITRNEETNLPRCLASIVGIADEVIVVDSGSTDLTCDIAREWGARVISIPWQGYGFNKNAGHDLATGHWILSIDADEWLSTELRQALTKLHLESSACYVFRRKNMYKGRPMKFGAYAPERKIRLFKRGSAQWDNRQVHERLVFDKHTRKVSLKGDLMHELSRDFQELSAREMRYAKLAAKEWRMSNRHPGFMKRHFGGAFHFVKAYLLKLGFLEGWTGWETSRLQVDRIQEKIKAFDEDKVGEYPDE